MCLTLGAPRSPKRYAGRSWTVIRFLRPRFADFASRFTAVDFTFVAKFLEQRHV